MPSAAASAILEGMPEAADLRVLRSDGVTWIFAGKTALFRFADGDAAMRNIAVAALRQIGFPGTQVAAALGLTTNYVATLHQRAQRDGTAGLVRPRGRPRTVTEQDWEQARAWRAAGVRDAEIARRLGVQQSTVLRRLGPAQVQGELELEDAAAAPGPAAAASREDQPLGPEPRSRAGATTSRSPGRRSARRGQSRGSCRRGSRGTTRDRRRAAGCSPGMRGRCCCTPTPGGPGRSCRTRRAARRGRRRCCRR